MNSIFNDSFSAAKFIQFMLAPAIMISACGLLLLGINNKYSLVVNRIRLLNKERRDFKEGIIEENTIRLESVVKQIDLLENRVRLVKNAVLSYAVAVGMFIATSVFLGIEFFFEGAGLTLVLLILFLFGMIAVFFGITYTFLETNEGYKIVKYEIQSNT